MNKPRFTFAEAKKKIKDLELELQLAHQDAEKRLGKKDFYQGIAWGAVLSAVVTIIICSVVFK